MSDERFEKVASLFIQASSLDPAKREAFLARIAKDDSELHREVLEMLRHDEQPAELLRTGSLRPAGSLEDETAPQRIGLYRVLELLGEGGMGVVYLAEQEKPIRRQVAIKLIRSGFESRRVVERFESERQALALMSHANIARVFDAGSTPEGRPYFAMEYVAGEPITRYCDRQRLTLRGRLDLFLQVCEGVQHAHRNAIIHRDLKPSNVLVSVDGGKPVPKIIDFGIAKALDGRLNRHTLYTDVGQLIGTPEYMSPEQTTRPGRNVDTRTDVYSLGVLLYELISGARPFDFDDVEEISYDEICRRIREEEPVRPSTRVGRDSTSSAEDASALARRVRRLRGELDWITLKALDKDPDRRYASASDLAADIGRYLRHEPVLAGPPSAIYRARKLLRKHSAVASLAALLLASLIGFIVTGAIQASRISREAAATAEMSGFLLDLFEPPPVITLRGVLDSPRVTLDKGVEKVRAELSHRPLLQARLLRAIGGAYQSIGAHHEAFAPLEEGRAMLEAQLGRDHAATIGAVEAVGNVYKSMFRYAEAEPYLVEVLEARRLRLGEDHLDTLRSMSNLGDLYKVTGRAAEAARLFEQSIPGMELQLGEDDPDTLAAKGRLAGVYLDLGSYQEAAAMLPDLARRMKRVFGNRGETLIALYNLGCAWANLGDKELALDYLKQSVDAGWSYPGSMFWDMHLEPLLGHAELDRLERQSRLNSGDDWMRWTQEAGFMIRQGRYDQAEHLLREILEAITRVHGSYVNIFGFGPLLRLADLHLRQQRFDEAERILHQCLRIGRDDPVSIDPGAITHTLKYLAQCYVGWGEIGEARRLIDEAQALHPFNRRNGQAEYHDATWKALSGQRDEALRLLAAAADRGYADVRWLDRDLAFRSLRDDPGFKAIAARIERRAI